VCKLKKMMRDNITTVGKKPSDSSVRGRRCERLPRTRERYLIAAEPRYRKLAVTVLAAFMVTVQVVPFAVSQPCQPVKMERKPGVAVSVTTLPLLKSAEQVDPQSIPGGLDVTVPPKRRPVFFTIKGTVTVKLLALSAVPPVVVTLIGPVVAPVGTVA